ncbi:MAG: GntR family transcriptional regulator [Burkholderiaceae bacterium]
MSASASIPGRPDTDQGADSSATAGPAGHARCSARPVARAGVLPDARSPTRAPLYLQTYELLTRSLQQGEWLPGELIPGEQQLARRFAVSPGTVRKAIDRLVGEHILMRRQGKGTFVASHLDLDARAGFRFLRMRDTEDRVPDFKSRILYCRKIKARADIAARLNTNVGAGLVRIRRVLDFQSSPTVLDDLWLPAARFRGLNLEQLNSWEGPLYGLFESAFGTQIISATERVTAVQAPAVVAQTLGVRRGSPLLQVDRVTETYDGEKAEFRRGYYVTAGYHYLSKLG